MAVQFMYVPEEKVLFIRKCGGSSFLKNFFQSFCIDEKKVADGPFSYRTFSSENKEWFDKQKAGYPILELSKISKEHLELFNKLSQDLEARTRNHNRNYGNDQEVYYHEEDGD